MLPIWPMMSTVLFPPEVLMNTASSYEAAYWLEQISYNISSDSCCAMVNCIPPSADSDNL